MVCACSPSALIVINTSEEEEITHNIVEKSAFLVSFIALGHLIVNRCLLSRLRAQNRKSTNLIPNCYQFLTSVLLLSVSVVYGCNESLKLAALLILASLALEAFRSTTPSLHHGPPPQYAGTIPHCLTHKVLSNARNGKLQAGRL